MPVEYQQAEMHLDAFLTDVRDACELGSRHQAYTTAQAVFQLFRRRLTLAEGVRFANILPGLLRALFVAEWDPAEVRSEFSSRTAMETEVRALRPLHNFAPAGAIAHVAWALRRQTEPDALAAVLEQLGPEAQAFWRVEAEASAAQAAAWRALSSPGGE